MTLVPKPSLPCGLWATRPCSPPRSPASCQEFLQEGKCKASNTFPDVIIVLILRDLRLPRTLDFFSLHLLLNLLDHILHFLFLVGVFLKLDGLDWGRFLVTLVLLMHLGLENVGDYA